MNTCVEALDSYVEKKKKLITCVEALDSYMRKKKIINVVVAQDQLG
jgi:hypothetical protein